MRIRLTSNGQVIDIPAAEAQKFISDGRAVPAGPEEKRSNVEKR